MRRRSLRASALREPEALALAPAAEAPAKGAGMGAAVAGAMVGMGAAAEGATVGLWILKEVVLARAGSTKLKRSCTGTGVATFGIPMGAIARKATT